MILSDKEALKRLASPMNLINQLRSNGNKRNSAMSLFGIGRNDIKEVKVSFNPFETSTNIPPLETPVKQFETVYEHPKTLQPLTPSLPPQTSTTLDNILENHESQIKLGLAHDKALELLNSSVNLLSSKLDEVRADKLPSVVTAASKVVESIRRERNEAAKNGKDREVHYHFYTPQQSKLSEYEIIDVTP